MHFSPYDRGLTDDVPLPVPKVLYSVWPLSVDSLQMHNSKIPAIHFLNGNIILLVFLCRIRAFVLSAFVEILSEKEKMFNKVSEVVQP